MPKPYKNVDRFFVAGDSVAEMLECELSVIKRRVLAEEEDESIFLECIDEDDAYVSCYPILLYFPGKKGGDKVCLTEVIKRAKQKADQAKQKADQLEPLLTKIGKGQIKKREQRSCRRENRNIKNFYVEGATVDALAKCKLSGVKKEDIFFDIRNGKGYFSYRGKKGGNPVQLDGFVRSVTDMILRSSCKNIYEAYHAKLPYMTFAANLEQVKKKYPKQYQDYCKIGSESWERARKIIGYMESIVVARGLEVNDLFDEKFWTPAADK